MEKKIPYSELQDTLNAAKNQMNLLVDQCAKDEQTIEALQKENCNLKEANERLQIAAINAKNSTNKLKRAYKNLHENYKLAMRKCSDPKAEKVSLEDYNNLQKTVEGLKRNYSNLRKDRCRLMDKNKELEKINLQFSKENEILKQDFLLTGSNTSEKDQQILDLQLFLVAEEAKVTMLRKMVLRKL